MQRVKLSLACLLCLSWVSAAMAQTALESDLGVATLQDYSGGVSYGGAYFDVRTMTGDGVGYRNGFTQLGVVYPVWMSEDMYIAPNIRMLVTDNSEIGVNAGGMIRRYNADRDRIFGGYAYYDSDNSSEGFDYSQFMFGLETLGERWDARFNAYFPTNSDENFVTPVRLGTDPIFFGNSLGFLGQAIFQEAVAGADIEFGGPLTKRTPWLRGFAGAYAYDADENDPVGFRGRVEAWISDDLSVGVNVTEDRNYGTNVNAVVDFRFSGWKPTRYFPQWSTRERMMMPVQRNWRVATANTEKDVQVPGKNPRTGDPYFIVHVDASNPLPGDGSFENPFSDLPASAPGADIILVQRDGTSIINPLSGSIALSNWQRLLGEGKAHQAEIIGMFGGIMTQGVYTLPGIDTDGTFPYLTSPGNIITIASNNEVSAFNLINAGGFAVTNVPAVGSHNFDLNCLNITGNNGGIFLTNATGTGILRDINALNNNLGGISIDSGATTLNLTGTNIVSSSLPDGVQDFGIRLIAQPGTINAALTNVQLNRNVDGLLLEANNAALNVVLTDASIDDSTNDGVRITGTNGDIAFNLSSTTINRSGGEGLQAITTGGSLDILGRNVTVNNSNLDNVNLAMTNTDMAIDFRNAIFNDSVTGSGFVLSNTGGSGGGTLMLENVTGTNNFLDGLSISGNNFTQIEADVRQSIFSNNGRDAVFVSATNSAEVDLDIRTTIATGSGRHGINFNATTGGQLDMNVLASNFSFSGSNAALAGNGINGFADNATVDLTVIGTSMASSGNHGMFVTAQNNADVTISVNQGNFQNSGQNTAGGDAVNIVTDTGADLVLQINNTPMDNTVPVPGGTQDDGLVFTSTGGSTVLANVSNSSLSNNLGNAIDATVSDLNTSVTLNLLNVTGEFSGEDGILFDVQNDGQFTINSQTASFNNSGAGGTGDGVDGFIRSGGDVTFNWVATTVRNSAENGLLLDIAGVGSSFTATIQSGNFSDSGQAQLGMDQQDAFHITAADESLVDIAMLNTPSANSFDPPAGTQQRGLWADVATGADLSFDNQSGDMSNNLLNAINITVANAGSTAFLNLQATPANNSGEHGFRFDVSDSGILVGQFTDSTLDNSGSTGIVGDDFDAINGMIDTNGLVVLNFVNTPVTNANKDGMHIVASNDGTLLATFDNSPLDNSGMDNEGDALRLTFSSGAVGIVTLQNGSTATNAGDDAIFITATDLNTSVTVNALNSDLSDSGTTATAGGGNGIRALVTNDAEVNLNIVDTDVTNTLPTTPQVRGLFFDVTAGGQLTALFDNSDMSGHDLDGINGSVDGTGVADSSATIALVDTIVDFNVLFGGIFNVTNEGDLTLLTGGTSSFSGNGANGLFVNVDGADSTFTFSFDGTAIDNNGVLVGGDGMTVIADNGAAIFGEMDSTSISGNANAGLVLVLDNASTADLGVTTAGLIDTVIDGNGNEGILAIVDNASFLDFNMIGGSVSNNGAAGTAGDLNDSFDNVRVEAFNGSDVEVQFLQTVADGATRNGFNFIAQDSIFLAQLRAGVSASGNTGGSGVRFVAGGPTTQAVLFMDDESADGMLTGMNAFNDNGTEPTLINTPTDPFDGFPQTGSGVFFWADNVDVAGIRFSGGASNNGNAADPLVTRDIDADGDGDDDGVHVTIDTANLAAVEFAGAGDISGNVDEAIDLRLANIGTLGIVTQPSDLTPPSVTIGGAGPGILVEDLTLDGNGGGLRIVLDNTDLDGNDIIIRNNTITNNTDGDGVLLSLDTVANANDITFQNNNISGNGINPASAGHGVNLQLSSSPVNSINFIGLAPAGEAGAIPQVISGNGMDGIHLVFMNSDVADMLFDNNTISGNGVAGIVGEGSGIHYAVVNPSDIGPVVISNNTIDNNALDGVRVVNVAPSGGLWDFTFDSNLSISGNQGFGVNFTLPNGLADLNLVMTDNAGINNNALGGVNLALDQNNTLTMTDFYGNTVSGNGGPGVLLTADDGSTFTWNLGDSTQAANLIDDNDDAGVAVDLVGTATGTLVVENTTISSTNDGANYGGDGLAIRLTEFATLPNLMIGDAALINTTFDGNAGNGVGIFLNGAAQLTNPLIQNSDFTNNTGDGLNVNRQGSGVVDNVVITNNLFDNNADGIDITAQFALLVDEYNINNNLVTNNRQNGIRFTAQGDGQISTVLTNNIVEDNLDDGVNILTITVSAGDAARVVSSAAWTGNSFSFNGTGSGDAGIDISGIHSLVIGVNDGNPLTFSNQIVGNTGDGVEVNGPNFVGGTLTIIDADISGNNTEGSANGLAGVDINGTFNSVLITNSRISGNLGDGVEIDNNNVTFFPSVYTLNDNIISFNGRDGVEFVSGGNSILNIGGTNTTLSQITDNGTSGTGGRGVDIIAGGSDITNTTVNINNTSILRNAQEGVYAVLTASATQGNAANRDSLASAAMATDGALTITPLLNLNVGNGGGNIINNNGQPGGNIGGAGLVIRVGTTRGGDGPTSPGGAGGGFASAANGGVLANVQNNQLFGNFGADVFIHSFVSIGTPGNSGTSWTDQNENPRNAANDVYNPAGYQSDPLARLDLIFNSNSGEELAGTNVGASYNNADAVFKSRGTTGVGPDNANDGGADDDGPFSSGSRVRNAQRLAARNVGVGGTQLPPLLTIGASDTFLFPGLGQSTFRVSAAGNAFGAGNGFILDGNPFMSTLIDANGVGPAGTGVFGIDNVPWGWTLLP